MSARHEEPLSEKLDRIGEMFERATAADAVKVTYLPVSWWRQPITLPAWQHLVVAMWLILDGLEGLIR